MPETNEPLIPTSELTGQQLRWSYWYVTNKLRLRKALVVFLFVVAAVFWLYAIYGLIVYLLDFQRLNSEAIALLHSPSSAQQILDQSRPQPLQFSEATVLPAASGHYDLLVQAHNPNKDWLALFDYELGSHTSSAALRAGFVLPDEDNYLVGIAADTAQAGFKASNFRWQRIEDFSSAKKSHDRFVIENEQYLRPSKAGQPAQVSFDITNDSAYSYWQVNAAALLYGGGSIVAVNYATISRLKSLEKRTIEMNWAHDLPAVDSIQIVPEVNYLDSGAIMPPGY